jgi:alpha-L-fucosidase
MIRASFFVFLFAIGIQVSGQTYQPTAQNLVARNQFQDNRFGMFVHWGVSSMLGSRRMGDAK